MKTYFPDSRFQTLSGMQLHAMFSNNRSVTIFEIIRPMGRGFVTDCKLLDRGEDSWVSLFIRLHSGELVAHNFGASDFVRVAWAQ